MHRMDAIPLRPRQKLDSRLEQPREEQNLEVQMRLLVRLIMRLAVLLQDRRLQIGIVQMLVRLLLVPHLRQLQPQVVVGRFRDLRMLVVDIAAAQYAIDDSLERIGRVSNVPTVLEARGLFLLADVPLVDLVVDYRRQVVELRPGGRNVVSSSSCTGRGRCRSIGPLGINRSSTRILV